MSLRRPCCCKPPCTCLIAKESFRGVANTISVSGPSISIPDRCLAGNYLTGSLSASTTIDYDDGFCGESVGDSLCPAVQSHYFGPLSITVGDFVSLTKQCWLHGRNGNCLNPLNECSIVDNAQLIDTPGFCAPFNEYGQQPAHYEAIAKAGVGISYSCQGGNTGTPIYSLYVSAQYQISESATAGGWLHPFQGVPVAPTGWTRSDFGSNNYLYSRSDGRATMTFAPAFKWYIFGKVCNGVGIPFSSNEVIWQLSAFTLANTSNATSVTLDYPFDPAGIFSGITGTVT